MNALSIMVLVAALLLILSGMFCLMRTRHIIRIILGIEVAMKAITLLLIYAGNVSDRMALAQSFVVTMIVAEVVVAVVAAGIAVNVFRRYGSMDLDNLTKLRG
ncbi:MAG: NADH-quinone oxidoreductase subunit K [Clostridiales bacterium]|nr:NADH-quinone oxidoreductase subunit K [Clostridiales bacterium]